jgi:hypothetical protein
MPTKPLDRLMFVQGGACFFCRQALPRAEASVEHLHATANGGGNQDDNCVACCKAVNALFGSMSLKEKFQVVLNQQGKFKCPNASTGPSTAVKPVVPSAPTSPQPKKPVLAKLDLNAVVVNLKQRGNSKPRTVKTLTSTVASLLPQNAAANQAQAFVAQLVSSGKVTLDGNKVSYAL